MRVMYPGTINSPLTTLSSAISSTDVTITVVDGSLLPEAPNLATILNNEDAETILYAVKIGNTLSSITRGFQGVATNWPSGTEIGRLFTAYDHDSVRLNLEELASSNTGVIESEVEPTTNLSSGLIWYKPSTDDTKIYLNGAFRSVGGGAGGKLVWRRNAVVLTDGAASVLIGIEDYDKASDMLMVFQNSVYIEEGIDYTINSDSSAISTISGAWDNETEFNFIVFKSGSDTGSGPIGTGSEVTVLVEGSGNIEINGVSKNVIDLSGIETVTGSQEKVDTLAGLGNSKTVKQIDDARIAHDTNRAMHTRSATVIVASSNSSQKSQDGADFVCTGTDDQVTINNAIATLPSYGGKVLLLEGLYTVSKSILLPQSVTLQGMGTTTMIRVKDGGSSHFSMVVNANEVPGESDIVVKDLLLDGNKANNPDKSIYGIAFSTTILCIIENVTINNVDQFGIQLYDGSTKNTITKCYISYNSIGGIHIDSDSHENLIAFNILIRNGIGIYVRTPNYDNRLIGNECGFSTYDGISIDDSSKTTILNNYCHHNGSDGIHVFGSSQNLISNNKSSENVRHGIYIAQSGDDTVTSNFCESNTSSGITLDSVNRSNVQGNTVRRGSKTPTYGICINAGTGNTVTNNDLYDSGTTKFSDAGTGTITKSDALIEHVADYVKHPPYGDTGGTATAYTFNPGVPLPTLDVGVGAVFKAHVASGTNPTFNYSGKGAKPLRKPNGQPAKIDAGGVYTARYDGTAFILQGEGGEYGTAGAAQVLTGYTVGSENGVIPGTMPYYPAMNVTPAAVVGWEGNLALEAPNGYYSGSSNLLATSPAFAAANFRADKNVFGLQGSMPIRASEEYPGWRRMELGPQPSVATRLHMRFPLGVYMDNPSVPQGAGYMGAFIDDAGYVSSNILNTANIFGLQGTAIPRLYAEGTTGTVPNHTISLGFAPKMVYVAVWTNNNLFFWNGLGTTNSPASGYLSSTSNISGGISGNGFTVNHHLGSGFSFQWRAFA